MGGGAELAGKQCATFAQMVASRKLGVKTEEELIRELKEYLFDNNILFIDCSLENILVNEFESGKYRLMIIDGLGGRRMNWRYKLYFKSKLYTKYKVRKQWKKFINLIKIARSKR